MFAHPVALVFALMVGVFSAEASMTPQEFFNRLSKDNMGLVDEFYAEDAVFQDPIGVHNGRATIRKYYAYQYENVTSIRFEFGNEIRQGDFLALDWTMYLQHKTLGGGKPIVVTGTSHFKFAGDKAVYQRDYFDMGEFVYERIPVLGRLIQFIKKKLEPPG